MIDFAINAAMPKSHRLLARLPTRMAELDRPAEVTSSQQVAISIVELMAASIKELPPTDIIECFVKPAHADSDMWAELGDRTITVMARGINHLAMLWLSASKEGNGDAHVWTTSAIPNAEVNKRINTPSADDPDPFLEFLPSLFIDRIADVL